MKSSLEGSLKKLEELLRKHDVFFWVNKIKAARDEEDLRRLFGGMGSLNDLIICKANGHQVEDEEAANKELDCLTRQVWRLISEK